MHYIFVYGTLRKNEANAHFLQDSICIANESWTYGSLFDTNEGYPAMIHSKNKKVYGEVYRVTDAVLRDLDKLEEYTGASEQDLYNRITQAIYINEKILEAYVYIAQKQDMLQHQIVEGDWVSYRKLLYKNR